MLHGRHHNDVRYYSTNGSPFGVTLGHCHILTTRRWDTNMNEYCIVESDDSQDLANMVADAMRLGWIPQGGIAIGGMWQNRTLYYQALVK